MRRSAKEEPFSRCRSATTSRLSSGQTSAPSTVATRCRPQRESCASPRLPVAERNISSSSLSAVPGSNHRLRDQIVRRLGQRRVGGLAIDRLTADLEHDRHRQRRYMLKLLMNDSALDAREHLRETGNIEEAGGRI